MGMKCRLLAVEGAYNVRDLGGYPGEDGMPVAMGRFFRGGALSGLTREGCQAIRDQDIRLIADLRSRMEAARQPDTLERDGEIGYLHVPLLDYINSNIITGELAGFPASMAEMYTGLLDNDGPSFQKLLHVFARQEGAVLFHCTAGKDRTGVVAMLLLKLAGVADGDVVEDYSYSQELLFPVSYEQKPANLPEYLFESRPETMQAVLGHLQQRYGGAEEYLDRIGLEKEDRTALKAKLLGR